MTTWAKENELRSQPLQREFASYELLPDAPPYVDQHSYWLAHTEQFPTLSHLDRIIFTVPVARSKSERIFSAAGNTLTTESLCES